MLSAEDRQRYDDQGYLVARGLFAPAEVEFYTQHYMAMRERESAARPASGEAAAMRDGDPLKRYPRLMQMHRHDPASLDWLIDARLDQHLTGLLGRSPYAVQTMMYFKPAGARGQALHQDQYYLRVQPGTCMAAWLALDDCDEQNGCLFVVPGSHTWPVLCAVPADTTASFTDVTVDLPPGARPVPVLMRAGDVLFFNGQLVHGSFPNTSASRFRRALIGHYIVGEAEAVYKWYHPALRMDGTPVTLDSSADGGACGTWVERDGTPVLEFAGGAADAPVAGPH